MATDGGVRERCDRCGDETPHDVRLEIRTESAASENAVFSREPYRVAACRHCGDKSTLRMNDA
jgi:ribosomal protein L37E